MSSYVSRFDWPDWEPIPRKAYIAWLAFYAIFLGSVFLSDGAFLVIDHVNLAFHEAGHLFLRWYGPMIRLEGRNAGIWGGLIFQWAAPIVMTAYFYSKRCMPGFICCLFWFFENWLFTAAYMVSARTPLLVTVGGVQYVERDWFTIFSGLGVLQYNYQIAGVVHYLGRFGMLGCVAGLGYWWWKSTRPVPEPWLIEPSLP